MTRTDISLIQCVPICNDLSSISAVNLSQHWGHYVASTKRLHIDQPGTADSPPCLSKRQQSKVNTSLHNTVTWTRTFRKKQQWCMYFLLFTGFPTDLIHGSVDADTVLWPRLSCPTATLKEYDLFIQLHRFARVETTLQWLEHDTHRDLFYQHGIFFVFLSWEKTMVKCKRNKQS